MTPRASESELLSRVGDAQAARVSRASAALALAELWTSPESEPPAPIDSPRAALR